MNYIIDSKNLNYKSLNLKIKNILANLSSNPKDIKNYKNENINIDIKNVLGQRYIGDGLEKKVGIKIYGTPGNDLGAFMDGPMIEVYGNGQDGVGNTMNSGRIIIHGIVGDILGYSMRGGEIYIENDIGCRGGIHIKSYLDKIPVIVIGGSAGDFLGEYMAGGIIIILGLSRENIFNLPFRKNKSVVGNYTGTGMHGGNIYIRGDVEEYKLGKEVKKNIINNNDKNILNKYIDNFCSFFNINNKISTDGFFKLTPYTHRPYGKLYAY